MGKKKKFHCIGGHLKVIIKNSDVISAHCKEIFIKAPLCAPLNENYYLISVRLARIIYNRSQVAFFRLEINLKARPKRSKRS